MSLEQHILITTSNFAFSEVHLFRTDITPPNFSRWYIRSPCWSKWSGCSFCSSCLTCWQFGHALLAPTWSNLPFLLYCLVFPSLFFGARFSCYAQSWTHALCVKKKNWKKAQQPHQFQRICVFGNINHRTWAASLHCLNELFNSKTMCISGTATNANYLFMNNWPLLR